VWGREGRKSGTHSFLPTANHSSLANPRSSTGLGHLRKGIAKQWDNYQSPELGHRTLRCSPPFDLNSVLQPGTSAKNSPSSQPGCDGLIEGEVGQLWGKGSVYVKRTSAPSFPHPLGKSRAPGGRREDSSEQKL